MAVDYYEYINSDKWRWRRKAFLNRLWPKQCAICRRQLGRFTNVHHLTYKRLGHEWDQDLQALCRDCHTKVEAEKGNVFWHLLHEFAKTKDFSAAKITSNHQWQAEAQRQKDALARYLADKEK